MKWMCVCMVLMLAQPAAADNFLVTPKGIWKIVDGVPTAVTGPGDTVVYLNGNHTPNPDNGGNGDSGGSIFPKAKQLSKDLIANDREARIVAAVVRILTRDDVVEENIEKGFKRGLAEYVASLPGIRGNRIAQWVEELDDLEPTYDKDLMHMLDMAVTEAWGIEPGEMETNADVAALGDRDLIDAAKTVFAMFKRINVLTKHAQFEVVELIHSKSLDEALKHTQPVSDYLRVSMTNLGLVSPWTP